ncbi:MAG: hypothetical protein FWD47_09905 [Treponema sp.]|nr:hypothetical protein [Treponema sp.]
MKKCVFVMVIIIFGCIVTWANPVAGVPGVVSYEESLTVFFDSENNAIRWIETQMDFMAHREVPAAQRRIMGAVLENMIPILQDITMWDTDFCVIISRSTSPGESILMLYVRGTLTRLWNY